MKIFELEQSTGLERATIRYYEKEGFIAPKRTENGYRDYSEEDRSQLLKIRLLRQLGMSLDRIRNLQQGSEDFSTALSEQIRILESQVKSAENAKHVCEQMRDHCVCYDTLDAQYYLELMSAAPTQSNKMIPEKTFREPNAIEEYHPVRRYVARYLDYRIISAILNVIFVLILRIRPFNSFENNLISYLTPFFAVPLMAAMLHFFAVTPGKWLMGIEVRNISGEKLSYGLAIAREWDALRYGYGFGIPFWKLWKLYQCYKATSAREKMPWDSDWRCDYHYPRWGRGRKAAFAAAAALLTLISVTCAMDASMPKYRGDITVAQFAENYNALRKTVEDDVSPNQLLQEDGTWANSENIGLYVDLSGSENNDYSYTTENGYLKKIVYDNKWTHPFALEPLNTPRCVYLILTVLYSQREVSLHDTTEFQTLWAEQQDKTNADFQYENIRILWEIQAENCDKTTSGYIGMSEEESYVSVHLEVIIQ